MMTKLYAAQPIQRKRRRVALTRYGNVISADFASEVRERNARWETDDAKTRRLQLIDGALISAMVAGLLAAMIMGWPA